MVWCDHCVKGQAKDRPHSVVKGMYADSSIVRVSMDYCFLSEDAESKDTEHETSETAKTVMTIMVMVETLCRSVWAYACESKGASEQWMVDQIVDDFQAIGLTNERLIIKSDQENSITEVPRGVVAARAGHGTAIENGKVERAIQDVNGAREDPPLRPGVQNRREGEAGGPGGALARAARGALDQCLAGARRRPDSLSAHGGPEIQCQAYSLW